MSKYVKNVTIAPGLPYNVIGVYRWILNLHLFSPLTIMTKFLCAPHRSSFTVPSGVMISRPYRTSNQSFPFIAICVSLVIRSISDAFIHPLCDVATVWRLWSSTPSLPAHFPLDHAPLHWSVLWRGVGLRWLVTLVLFQSWMHYCVGRSI